MFQITDPKLKWLDPSKLAPIPPERFDGLALHHEAGESDVYETHKQHQEKDPPWNGIGYGYYIALDGTIYLARGFNQNAGVAGHNEHVLSVVFQGNYDTRKVMPDIQFNAGVWLVHQHLKPKMKNLRVIHGHGYWKPTACPGKFFPVAEILVGKFRGKEESNMAASDHYYFHNKAVINTLTFDPKKQLIDFYAVPGNGRKKLTDILKMFRGRAPLIYAMNGGIFNMQTGEAYHELTDDGKVIKPGNDIPRVTFAMDWNNKPYIQRILDLKELTDPKTLRFAIGGFGGLVNWGQIYLTAEQEYVSARVITDRTRRHFVGIKKDGQVIFSAVEDATMEEAAQLALGLGCYNAVNMDGGGSVGMAVMDAKGTIKMLAGSDSRPLANCFLVFVK